MARRRTVSIERVEVHRRRWLPGRIAAAMIAGGMKPGAVLRLVHGLEGANQPPADVIVSAGAETMPANVAWARVMGVPNLFYGSLRAFDPDWFALVLTSYAAQAGDPHPVMTLKPSKLDPDRLPTLALTAGKPPRHAGLLIGGDGGGATFAEADWAGLLGIVAETHAAWGTTWTVANSRRTPEAVSDRLVAAVAGGAGIESFIDVREAGSGTLEQLFAGAELVVVTADSSSMLSEAVWSRRPVLSLSPSRHAMTRLEGEYREYLHLCGYCRQAAIAEITPVRLLRLVDEIKPLERNPLDHLSDLLALKLPDLF